MISITCTNCQTTLTIDEAFAGGVCRCQHCGTIQTVPKAARGGVGSGVMAQAAGSQKTLWKQKTASDTTHGTGLDELADIVASSGLAGSGLQSGGLRKRTPPPATAASNKKMVPIMAAAGGGAIAVLLVVLIWALTRGDGPSGADGTGGMVSSVDGDATSILIAGPGFATVSLKPANTVVFVIDRGSGTSNVFADLKRLTVKSIGSLGGGRKFQIVFWQVRGEIDAYPASGATVAGESAADEAARTLEEITPFGSSSVGPALRHAASAKPDAIVLATGKSADYLDDAFTAEVEQNLPPGVKVHTFSVAGGDSSALRRIAEKTGGVYRMISEAELRGLK